MSSPPVGTPAVEDGTPVVDSRGRRCPQPVIDLAVRMRGVPVGTVVTLLADDPAARLDVPAWCAMRGQTFLGEQPAGTFRVRRQD